jgi:hypothetical protein
MAWNVWVVNTINGVRRQRIPVSAFTWERVLNASGSGSATIQIWDDLTSKLPFLDLTEPVKRTWVLSWDETAVYAGVVWSQFYDKDAGTLTVRLGDIWSLLAGRLAIDRGATNLAASKLSYSGLSLADISKRIVQSGITTPSNDWLIPFSYAADTGGSGAREYFGYNFPTVADVLDELMKAEGGPDIDFQPQWTAGANPTLQWGMRAGNLNEGNWEWNLAAPKSGVTGLTWTEDATKVATSVIGRGEGSEKNVIHKREQANGLGYALERVESTQLKTLVDVSAHARAALAAYQTPTQQMGMSIMAGGHVPVSDLKLGGRVRLFSSGDPVISDGLHINRLIQFSGSLDQPVKLGFQPVGG